MISTSITMIKLEASEGMTLTNGESYGKTVYLGANDSVENWHEITDEEAETLIEAQRQVDEEERLRAEQQEREAVYDAENVGEVQD